MGPFIFTVVINKEKTNNNLIVPNTAWGHALSLLVIAFPNHDILLSFKSQVYK